MARKRDQLEDEPLRLVHPVYLDIPMLVSFVAATEDGFSLASERTETDATATDRSRDVEGRARVGLPALGALIGLDMAGRYGRSDQQQESRETRVVRQHTEASLFNLLRHELTATKRIKVVESAEQLESVRTGELVEISGEIVGNPLEQVLDLFMQILPYLGYDVDALMKPKKRKDPLRSGNPSKRAGTSSTDEFEQEDLFRLLATMRTDLESSSMRDLVLNGPDKTRAVLTLSTEFLTSAASDRLLGGRFTVIGKVTRVLGVSESINLTRRTALGLGGPDLAREVVTDFTSEQDLFVDVGDPVVEAPGMQILPLGVFV